MLESLPSLNSLRGFEAAGRHLSFTLAAEELRVTQGAISYQVRNLEAQLGLQLFHRRVRAVVLTPEGARLLTATQRTFRQLSEEIESLRPGRSRDILTVAVSTYVATRWLSRRLNAFLTQDPKVTLRLQHSVNAPDFEIRDVDIAVRWGRVGSFGPHSALLLPMPMVPVCSPELLQGGNPLHAPKDLGGQTLLRDDPNDDLWPDWLELAGVGQESVGAGQVISDPNVRIQAAMDGQGVVLADDLVAEERRSGRLVAPFEWRLEGYGYHIAWPGPRERPVAKAFRNWLMAEAAA